MCYNNVRIPILAVVGLVLALVGVVGNTVIFPTFMATSGQEFNDQLSVDANGAESFADYNSGDEVVIVDVISRMQFEDGKTSVWLESIGNSDSDLRFIFSSDLMNDFGVGSSVIITFEVVSAGQSESVTNESINNRLSTTNEYMFIGLIAIGLALTVYGFYSSFRGTPSLRPNVVSQDDEWGSFDAPAAPVAPPVASPMSAPPTMMPPSEAAIPQQPAAFPPSAQVPTPAAVPTTMTITVPSGVVPGQVLTVTMPNGQVVNVQVPPGCASGSQFTISVTQ